VVEVEIWQARSGVQADRPSMHTMVKMWTKVKFEIRVQIGDRCELFFLIVWGFGADGCS